MDESALDALYATGHALLERDRARDALALFHTMLLVDPRDERGWLALATCHEQLDEPEKAIALCELAAGACEAPVRCAIARARLHRSLGATDAAREAYGEAARLAEAGDDRELTTLIAEEAWS
jgi:tetratricopeptide (TPR) repeat protein